MLQAVYIIFFKLDVTVRCVWLHLNVLIRMLDCSIRVNLESRSIIALFQHKRFALSLHLTGILDK